MKTFREFFENEEKNIEEKKLNERLTINDEWAEEAEQGNIPYVLGELNYQLKDIIDVYKNNRFGEFNKKVVSDLEKLHKDIKKLSDNVKKELFKK